MNIKLAAVTNGTLIPINECIDKVFSEKIMGDGYVIIPSSNEIASPVNGTIELIFPTKHAIGIKSENGDEIIIHVGIDTVSLNGEGFTTFVNVGETVTVGQKLLEVDFDLIKDKIPSIQTPVVISNIGLRSIKLIDDTHVSLGEIVATITE